MPKFLGKDFHVWADWISILFVISACILSTIQINKHIYHDHHPQIRRYIIRILLMIIIYAICSLLGLFQPEYSDIYEIIRDSYESIVIYSFYQLLIYTIGGYKNVEKQLSQMELDTYPHLWPFSYCFKPIQLRTTHKNDKHQQQYITFKLIKRITIGVLQYCFIQFAMAIVSFLLAALDPTHPTKISVIVSATIIVVRSISQAVAMYCLVLFYFVLKALPHTSKGYQLFVAMRPVGKFICIKGIVFFTYWQSVLITALVYFNIIKPASWFWNAQNIGLAIQNFIICIEMLLFSIGHWFAFRITDFRSVQDTNIKPAWKVMLFDVAFVGDLLDDAKQSTEPYIWKESVSTNDNIMDDDDDETSETGMIQSSDDELGPTAVLKLNKLKYYHAILITITHTLIALVCKLLVAFIPFIMIEFGYSYTMITVSLGIGSFTTIFASFMERFLLNLKSNLVYFILCIVECVGLFLLWMCGKNHAYKNMEDMIFFVIGVIIILNVERVTWRCSESMISVLNINKKLSYKIFVSLYLSWSLSAFLFIPSGVLWTLYSFWSYLEILFIVFIFFSIVNLLIIPKISVNKYRLIHSTIIPHESVGDDIKILCNLKHYKYIVLIAFLVFVAWSYFYSVFGIWLIRLYSWDVSKFGTIIGLMEGCGNLLSIILIVYVVKRDNKKGTSASAMMVWFGTLVLISMGVIWITSIMYYNNDTLRLIMISLYLCGSLGIFIILVTLNQSHIPILQQKRSSFILSITQSISICVAQCTISSIYESHTGKMRIVSTILIILYFIAFIFIIWINEIYYEIKIDPESMHINSKREMIKYT